MNRVPKLRFPEFSGEWKEKELGEMSMKIIDGDRGINYPSSSDFISEGHCLFLNAKNVTKTGFYFGENNFITEEKNELLKKGKLERGDLVLTTRGTVGNVAYFDEKINYENLRINSGMVILRNNGLEISSKYIYHYLISPKMEKEIINTSFGSAQPQLTVKNISSFKFDTPTLLEQDKIASFLSEVDKNIELLEEERELFQQYKKGMMQKIFSQELRFKDENGEEYPEWEEKELGELVKINTGKKDTQNKIEDGEYPFFVRSQTIEKIDSYSYDGEAIITAGDGVGVGKVFHYINGKFDYHQRVYKLSDFSEGIYGKYIYEFFKTNFIKEVTKYTAKTSVDSVRMEMITKMIFPVPSLPEQKKIADFLFSLDEKIQITSDELDGMKEFKKGLLQQMFM